MKLKFKKSLISFLPASLLLVPYEALAQTSCTNCVSQGLGASGFSSAFGNGGLTNVSSLAGLIIAVINIMLILSGIIAVVFIIIGGFQYMTSAGNEEQAEKGKKSLVNAIIGVVAILMAYAIVQVIVNLVTGTTL